MKSIPPVSRASIMLVCISSLCGVGMAFLEDDEIYVPSPFTLKSKPTNIAAGVTENPILRCDTINESNLKLKRVDKIRIMKKSENGWQLFAEKNPVDPAFVSDANAMASGRVLPTSPSATFVTVTWPVAPPDIFGTYKCDVIGSTDNGDAFTEATSQLVVQPNEMTKEDLLSLLLKTRDDAEKEIARNAKIIDAIKNSLMEETPDIPTLMREFLLRNVTIAWPGGEYALLQTDTGCPVDLSFLGGDSGYFRIHTESSSLSNANKIHPNSHMATPLLTLGGSKVFVYFRFCVVTRVFSTTPWPEGSYCVHGKGSNCPVGFSSGRIGLDTEDHQNADMFGGVVPFEPPNNLFFCCKSSGDPTTPMILPTESPFYLYRKDGRCQEVVGMDVINEFVEIDTEDYANHDFKEGNTPDSDLESDSLVRIELCYYKKK